MEHHGVTDSYVQEQLSNGNSYTLVLLKAGTKPNDEDAGSYQMEHLKFLFNLHQQKKISVFGPLLQHDNLRGIIVFNTTDKEEIKTLMDSDVFVSRNYFSYELVDFFSIPGLKLEPAQ